MGPSRVDLTKRAIKRCVPSFVQAFVKHRRSKTSSTVKSNQGSLSWMPLMRHRTHWPKMKAFALPSFYDGRIRVNLDGRESAGVVMMEDFEATLDAIESLLMECRESRTGRPVVKNVERVTGDPLRRRGDDVDLVVTWTDDVLGISHPTLGTIGPLPPRRTGGHTSPIGRCIVVGPNVESGEIGVRSSFDVVPTILDLVGAPRTTAISGHAFSVSTS
jgi:predicted AlkP superfamily phosphohydrolase/phosphomutase